MVMSLPGGTRMRFLGKLIKYWRSKDNRRVYTSAAGWPIIPENDYNLTSSPKDPAVGAGAEEYNQQGAGADDVRFQGYYFK